MLSRITTGTRASTSAIPSSLNRRSLVAKARLPQFDYRSCDYVPTVEVITDVDHVNEVIASLNSSRYAVQCEVHTVLTGSRTRETKQVGSVSIADHEGVIILHLAKMDLSKGLPTRLIEFLINPEVTKASFESHMIMNSLTRDDRYPPNEIFYHRNFWDLMDPLIKEAADGHSMNAYIAACVKKYLGLDLPQFTTGVVRMDEDLNRSTFYRDYIVNMTWATHLIGFHADKILETKAAELGLANPKKLKQLMHEISNEWVFRY